MQRAFQKLVATIPRIFFGAVFLLLSYSGLAQQSELWLSAEAQYKISKKLDLNFTNGTRFTDNISSFKSNLLELGLKKDLKKKMNLELAYRYVVRDSESGNEQRFALSYGIRKRVKPINFSARVKYQYDFSQIDSGESLVRTKFTVQYRRKKFPIRPSVFGELFFPFQNFGEVSQLRTGAAIDYPINKKMGLGVKYFYRKNAFSAGEYDHIFALGFSFELN